jgi:hypothetical protein
VRKITEASISACAPADGRKMLIATLALPLRRARDNAIANRE